MSAIIEFENAQLFALKNYRDSERYARIEERAPCDTDGAQWIAPLRVTFGWVEDIGIDSGVRRYFDRWTEATECCADWMGGKL